MSSQASSLNRLPATLAPPFVRMALGPQLLLTLLPETLSRLLLDRRLLDGRLVSRRPLPARSLLWSRLLSSGGIELRLNPLRLRSPSALRLWTLDGRMTFLPGRRRRLHGLLTRRASGRRCRLLTLRARASGSGRLRMLNALRSHGSLRSTG